MKEFKVKIILIFLILCMLSSCIDKQTPSFFQPSTFSDSSDNYVSGVVTPFLSLFTKSDNSFFLQQAFAATCSPSDVDIEIYLLDADGSKSSTPVVTTTIDQYARFSISNKYLVQGSTIRYIIEANGCSNHFSRAITALNANQNLDSTTTLATYLLNAETVKKFTEISVLEYDAFMNRIEGATVQDVVNYINSYSYLTTQLEDLFNTTSIISKLNEATPHFRAVNFPTEINEESSYTFQIDITHFLNLFQHGIEWHLNGIQQPSFDGLSSFIYTFNEDQQGSTSLTIYVGSSNGSNAVDRTKPYESKTFSFEVNDSSEAISPNFTLISDYYTNEPYVDIQLGISTDLSECQSFSTLGISIGSNSTSDDATFFINCNSANQIVPNIYLGSPSQGLVTVKLWAKDSNGNIGNTPKTIKTYYETNPPSMSLTMPTLLTGGIASYITFDATDSESGLSTIEFFYSPDGASANYSSIGTSNINDTSFSWTPPMDNVSAAKVKVVVYDQAGNYSETLSNTFTIDSSAPSLTVTSYPVNGCFLMSARVEGICESISENVLVEGDIADEPIVAPCSNNTFSVMLTLSNIDATNAVTFTQTDPSNNSSSITHEYYLDNSVPGAAPTIASTCTSTAFNEDVAYTCTPTVTDTNVCDLHSWSFDAANDCSWASIDASTGAVTGTPNDNDVGSCTLALKANDGGIDSNILNYTLTVDNVAPVLSIADAIAYEDSSATVIRDDSDVTASDEGWGFYTLQPASATDCASYGVVSIDASSGATTYTPALDYYGECNINVRFDDENASAIDSEFKVTVFNVQDNPVISSVCTPTTFNEDSGFSCNPIITDPDAMDVITWSFDTTNTCSWASIDASTGAISGTPNDDYVGNCTLSFKANDGTIDSNIETYTMTVSNITPTLLIADTYLMENDPATLIQEDASVAASDEGWGIYSIITASSPDCADNGIVSINATSGAITYDPTDDYVGFCNIKVQFDDQNPLGTVDFEFEVEVKALPKVHLRYEEENLVATPINFPSSTRNYTYIWKLNGEPISYAHYNLDSFEFRDWVRDYDGTVFGATYSASGGISGNSGIYTFDIDSYVTLPVHLADEIGADSFTISTWMKLNSKSSSPKLFEANNCEIHLGVGMLCGEKTEFQPFEMDDWQHLVITRSMPNGDIQGFINSEPQTVSKGRINGHTSDISSNFIHIGNKDTYDQGWSGAIDSLTFWKGVLSIEQINTLYNNGNPQFNKINLERYHSGDEISCEVIGLNNSRSPTETVEAVYVIP